MLCTLAEAYASALNSGSSLNIGDAWTQVLPPNLLVSLPVGTATYGVLQHSLFALACVCNLQGDTIIGCYTPRLGVCA